MYLLYYTYALISILSIVLSPRLTFAQTISVEAVKFDCQSREKIAQNMPPSASNCWQYPLDVHNIPVAKPTASEYSFTKSDSINFHAEQYLSSNQFKAIHHNLDNQIIGNKIAKDKQLNQIVTKVYNAEVPSIFIANWYNINFHNLEDQDANTIVTRFILPFTTGKLDHVARINMH